MIFCVYYEAGAPTVFKRLIELIHDWLDAYEDDVTFVQRTLREQQK